MGSPEKITVPKIEVFPGRLRLLVRLSADAPRLTNEKLIVKAYETHPTLPIHSCINSRGPTFGHVAEKTSIPHLLEHLIIAEQVCAARENATFVGTTHWTEKGSRGGEAIVEVSFLDDLQAFKAIHDALAFLNETMDA